MDESEVVPNEHQRRRTSPDISAPHSAAGLEPERRVVSHDEQHLIDAIRGLGWGRIEDLVIRGGVPRLTRDTKVFHRVRAERPARSTGNRRNPHAQHRKLLADCQRVGDGVITRIDVADGLPIAWQPPRSSKTPA